MVVECEGSTEVVMNVREDVSTAGAMFAVLVGPELCVSPRVVGRPVQVHLVQKVGDSGGVEVALATGTVSRIVASVPARPESVYRPEVYLLGELFTSVAGFVAGVGRPLPHEVKVVVGVVC